MSRPVSIQDAAILDAARAVFLRHGFRAGTKQVARAAGVSEGSLFKHFKNKNELFLAAMESEAGGSSWRDGLMRAVGTGDLRLTLETAGLQLLEHMRIVLPRIMMVRSSGIVFAGHPHCGPGRMPPPIAKIHALAAFFRAEVKAGRLAMPNPRVQAQIVIGALAHSVIQEVLFGFRAASPRIYVRTVVDMILRAAAPPVARPTAAVSRRRAQQPPAPPRNRIDTRAS